MVIPAAAMGSGVSAVESDARGASRFTLMLRSAKLIIDGREYLCVLRDVSAGGVKLRLFHPIPESKHLELELSGGDKYPLQMIWQKDGHAGLRFLGNVNLRQLIEDNGVKFPRRQLRLNLHHHAALMCHNEAVHVTLVNISQQGVCLDCDSHLLLGQRVVIEVNSQCVLSAKVSWRRYPHYGMVLEQVFSLENLAVQIAQLHKHA